MKIKRPCKITLHALNFEPTTVARLGADRPVRHLDATYEFGVGTPDDHTVAREWCSLLAPEVVCSPETSSSRPRRTFASCAFSLRQVGGNLR